MSDKELRQKTVAVLAEEFELETEEMTPDATLFDDLGLDSLDAVDMVVVLEKTFQIKMSDEEALRAIKTMEDLHQFLLKIQSKNLS